MNKIYPSWNKIWGDSIELSYLLPNHYDTIIGIANGGMIPATLIAKRLKVDRLLSANIKSYQNDKPRNNVHTEEDVVKVISFPSKNDLKDSKSVLIVDDLSDTGLTLIKVEEIIKDYKCNFSFATLYYKPKTKFKPYYTMSEIENNAWIVFPWES